MLVLPSRTIPPSLIPFIDTNSTPTRKMLNGYRMKLTKSLKVVLTNDSNYCGQAYCSNLKDDAQLVDKMKTYENQQEILEQVQNNFVLVSKKQVQFFDWKKQKITVQQISDVLKSLNAQSQPQDVGKNLFLSMFNTYQQLQLSGLQPILMPKQNNNNEPKIIEQQKTTNNYFGQSLLHVPQVNTKTGAWTKQNSLKLPIHNKQKQAQKQKVQAQ